MTPAQRRLIAMIRAAEDACEAPEYWPIVNDWVKDKGPAASLSLHNINRTVAALLRQGRIAIDDNGCFSLLEKA